MLLVDGSIYISGACINTTGACIKLYLVHVFMALVHVSIYYWIMSTSMNPLKMCRERLEFSHQFHTVKCMQIRTGNQRINIQLK